MEEEKKTGLLTKLLHIHDKECNNAAFKFKRTYSATEVSKFMLEAIKSQNTARGHLRRTTPKHTLTHTPVYSLSNLQLELSKVKL